MIYIVFANGDLQDVPILRQRIAALDEPLYVVGADGGSRYAAQLDLDLDRVIGDMDSILPDVREGLESQGVPFDVYPPEKNETDLELSLLHVSSHAAERHQPCRVIVLGTVGDRLDMTLANMLLLTHDRLSHIQGELWRGSQTAWLMRPPGGPITGEVGDTISLIPLGGDAQSVYTHGLRYRLQNEPLRFGPARGVSNVLSDRNAHIRFKDGILLVVHTPGRA
ncbi:MAG: thiamine diphosphokinase [Chloroflexi bacterium]|nr:thiamine diphosphokinase [Chloroflexota bacterium]